MQKILISLISDQAIPNILFIKQMKDMDAHIFVTTEKMENEGKSEAVIQVCNLDRNKVKKVVVVEDSLTDIKNKLEGLQLSSSDRYILNLTGGTKIMSIGVNRFFEDFDHESYYITIGKNTFKRIYPRDDDRESPFNYQLNLEEYFNAYGFIIEKSGLPQWATEALSLQFYNKFDRLPYQFTKIIKELRTWQQRNRDKDLTGDILPESLFDLQKLLDFLVYEPRKANTLNVEEIQFLCGGWWEAYVYHKLKKDLNLADNSVVSNCHIKRKNTPNELDIVFVKNNQLFVVECKTGFEQYRFTDAFNEAIYKLAALRRDMGIQIQGFVFILDKKLRENGEIKEMYKNRAETMHTKLIDKLILNNQMDWKIFIDSIK